MNSISGGYMSGTSTLEVYDADILSAVSGLIVTSMQYRYRTSSPTVLLVYPCKVYHHACLNYEIPVRGMIGHLGPYVCNVMTHLIALF
jgi:hypothetical protein